jgi:hypothetical protein
MKRLIVFLIIMLCLLQYQSLVFGKSKYDDMKTINCKTKTEKQVSSTIHFKVVNPDSKQEVEGARLKIINSDGMAIDTIITDKGGQAKTTITVSLDKKYFNQHNTYPIEKGTVAVIVYKEGYRETVLFEVPVTPNENYQVIPMYLVVSGQRNEPFVQLADIHHLTILDLVEKYRQ